MTDHAQVGRILHFVISDEIAIDSIIKDGHVIAQSISSVKCCPAIVVAINGPIGCVNLSVFSDGEGVVDWEQAVWPNHLIKKWRTWHWPRECSNLKDEENNA